MANLQQKNLLIAGGTSGIGLAITLQAATAGANVWALGRSQAYIDQAQAEVEALAPTGKVRFISADIHDSAALTGVFDQIGTVDHLIGNATGANRTIAPFMKQTADQFAEAFGKFWGYTNLVRCGVPYLSEQGSITLVSGTPARKSKPGMSSLSCVGASVEAFCRAMAKELAPIRVNAVAPGTIDTTMHAWMGDKKDERLHTMTAGQPIDRPGKPAEVAEAILFLAAADYITGSTLDVDGGQVLP